MKWMVVVGFYGGSYRKVILNARDEVIVFIDNLDSAYANAIVDAHNESLTLAREEGVEIAKSVYKQ